jgi:hypothetical protein
MEVMERALAPVVPSIPRQPPPPPPTAADRFSAEGGVIAGIVLGFVASLLVLTVLYSLYKGRRDSRARARAGAAAWAAAAVAPLDPRIGDDDNERTSRRASASSPTARQPAFAYGPPVKATEAGGGEEAATCSVCLGALQVGETVRLLPACLHLFHVECIDPWLNAHSTCPICRSDTEPSIDVARLPPV